jgi:hypothetical protein
MNIDEVWIDEGNITDRAPFVDHCFGRGPGTRPVLICHHLPDELFTGFLQSVFQQLCPFTDGNHPKMNPAFSPSLTNFKCQNTKDISCFSFVSIDLIKVRLSHFTAIISLAIPQNV